MCRRSTPVDHYNSVVEGNQGLIAFAEQLGERHTYDLLHAHDWLVAKAGIALKHRWKTPLITTIHATERGRHQGHIPSEQAGRSTAWSGSVASSRGA
jgi:glycogen synthase